tara:strand:+ start:409 stop:879 length:471 start_codon:yes stop_codon:yes gene_type:complete
MSLPRPASVFDAMPKREVARTGMLFPGTEMSVEQTVKSVIEMPDIEFNQWLVQLGPDPNYTDKAYADRKFRNDVLQIWMKMKEEDTKAQVKYIEAVQQSLHTAVREVDTPRYNMDGFEEIGGPSDARQILVDAQKDRVLKIAARADKIRTVIAYAT